MDNNPAPSPGQVTVSDGIQGAQDLATAAPRPNPQSADATVQQAGPNAVKQPKQKKKIITLAVGDQRDGTVTRVTNRQGAWVDIGTGKEGFLHKSQFLPYLRYNKEKLEEFQPSRHLKRGDRIHVWIHKLNRETNKIDLTLIRPDYKSIKNLKVGEKRHGVVKAVIDAAAFCDIGSDKDGFLPVSRLSQERVQDIHAIVKVGDEFDVWVTEISMPKEKGSKWQIAVSKLSPEVKLISDLRRGARINGMVKGFNDRGALLDVGVGVDAFMSLDEIDHHHIVNAADELEVGQEVEVMILMVSSRRRRLDVSRRRLLDAPDDEEIEDPFGTNDAPPMNAMELAFMKAQQGQGARKGRKGRKRKDQPSDTEQLDIITRTLQSGD